MKCLKERALKNTLIHLGSIFLVLASGLVKRQWEYIPGIKTLLGQHWTMMTCDTRGMTNQGSTALELQDDDIFVATFGRSGTMFMMNLLHQLRTGGDDQFADVAKLGRFFVPMSGLSREKLLIPQDGAPPRLFFTHGLPQQTPWAKYIIYIQRDPSMILRSWYLFMLQMYGFNMNTVPFEDYYFNCLRKHCVWPQDTLLQNLPQWWLRRHEDNILWLRFEDFRRNDQATFQLAHKVMNFLKPLPKMQRNISTIFDKFEHGFSKRHPEKFSLHMYNEFLDENLGNCAAHRPDYVAQRSHYGIKSADELNLTIHYTDTMMRHIRHTWLRVVYPVTKHLSYEDLLAGSENSIQL